jgi:hypothetical protein
VFIATDHRRRTSRKSNAHITVRRQHHAAIVADRFGRKAHTSRAGALGRSRRYRRRSLWW